MVGSILSYFSFHLFRPTVLQAEVEVTWEDQVQINEFGRLSQKLMQLESELDSKKVSFDFLTPK